MASMLSKAFYPYQIKHDQEKRKKKKQGKSRSNVDI